MSSSSPPPPPPPGPPPPGPPPPGPPPSGLPPPPGSPPPPPPPPPPISSPSITSANYFFAFVITFVVLLLLFIGCGLGSWRRFRLIGTAWDVRLQDIEGNPFGVRRRARRRLVRPIFLETWTSPTPLVAPLAPSKWDGVQPISAALVWSRSKLSGSVGRHKSDADASMTAGRRNEDGGGGGGGSVVRTMDATLWSRVFRRPVPECPPRPPPVQRPPPEAIQVAVMIAMPFQPSVTSGRMTGGYVGHATVGEYQIGVARIPWPSGEGP